MQLLAMDNNLNKTYDFFHNKCPILQYTFCVFQLTTLDFCNCSEQPKVHESYGFVWKDQYTNINYEKKLGHTISLIICDVINDEQSKEENAYKQVWEDRMSCSF